MHLVNANYLFCHTSAVGYKKYMPVTPSPIGAIIDRKETSLSWWVAT